MDSRETAVVIPVIVEVVEIEIAFRSIPVEIRDITIAIPVLPDGAYCAKYPPSHHLSNTFKIESDSESFNSLTSCTKYLYFLEIRK